MCVSCCCVAGHLYLIHISYRVSHSGQTPPLAQLASQCLAYTHYLTPIPPFHIMQEKFLSKKAAPSQAKWPPDATNSMLVSQPKNCGLTIQTQGPWPDQQRNTFTFLGCLPAFEQQSEKEVEHDRTQLYKSTPILSPLPSASHPQLLETDSVS